jgi:hypothetical protein
MERFGHVRFNLQGMSGAVAFREELRPRLRASPNLFAFVIVPTVGG